MNEWPVVVAALAGAIVGGLLTFANNWLNWRRRYTKRWDSKRLHAYQDFLASVLRTHRHWAVRYRSDSARHLIQKTESGLDGVITSLSALNLVASSEVKDNADRLLSALGKLVEMASEARASQAQGPWSAFDEGSFTDVLEAFISERSAFERSVQAELQVR